MGTEMQVYQCYHYTSKSGLEAIKLSGFIKESCLQTTDDAAFGQGVYLTKLTPDKGRQKIANNNYGPYLGQQMENEGRVECAIRLLIPQDKLTKANIDRDVWIHKGIVNLSDYKWEAITWD